MTDPKTHVAAVEAAIRAVLADFMLRPENFPADNDMMVGVARQHAQTAIDTYLLHALPSAQGESKATVERVIEIHNRLITNDNVTVDDQIILQELARFLAGYVIGLEGRLAAMREERARAEDGWTDMLADAHELIQTVRAKLTAIVNPAPGSVSSHAADYALVKEALALLPANDPAT